MPQDLLRKYIMYAREKVKPKLHNMDQEKLAGLFADLRRESLATGSFPVTVRLLESMIRMAEASAKMHLREYVRADDIDRAVAVAVGSFISAQKTSIKRSLERVSGIAAVVMDSLIMRMSSFFTGIPKVSDPRTRPPRTAWLLAGSTGKR